MSERIERATRFDAVARVGIEGRLGGVEFGAR
jgi:hypothetical protein